MNIITRFIVSGLLLVPALLIAQSPVAHFSATKTAICDNVYNESFTDLSTNKPTSWKWYFSGATPDTSTLQNPTNIMYKGYGCYAVKLVVQNNSGADSLTDSNYVCLYAPPSIVIKGGLSSCQSGSGIHDTVIVNGGDSIFYINIYPLIPTTYHIRVHNGPCYLDTSLTFYLDSIVHFHFQGDIFICVGNSAIIYALPIEPYGGGYKYLWSTGSTADSIIVKGITVGSYVYNLTVTKGGCQADSQITVGVHDCTGVEDYDDPRGEVEVYPNPSKGVFTIQSSVVSGQSSVEIYNVLGENIYQAKINSDNTAINLSEQSNGVYLYRITTETGNLVEEGKMVIQH